MTRSQFYPIAILAMGGLVFLVHGSTDWNIITAHAAGAILCRLMSPTEPRT